MAFFVWSCIGSVAVSVLYELTSGFDHVCVAIQNGGHRDRISDFQNSGHHDREYLTFKMAATFYHVADFFSKWRPPFITWLTFFLNGGH